MGLIRVLFSTPSDCMASHVELILCCLWKLHCQLRSSLSKSSLFFCLLGFKKKKKKARGGKKCSHELVLSYENHKSRAVNLYGLQNIPVETGTLVELIIVLGGTFFLFCDCVI